MKEFLKVNEQKGTLHCAEDTPTYLAQELQTDSNTEVITELKEQNEDMETKMQDLGQQYQYIEGELVKYKFMAAQLDIEND